MERLLASVALVALTSMSSGCANVKPWDRDVLARDSMQIVSDPVDQSIDDHIYFSKEASSGGQGFGGGGCGCN
jgi:Domain of unknown function (DUF4266)